MAKKGVKKIGLATGTEYYPNSSKGNLYVVPAGKNINFKVIEWYPNTTENQKKDEVYWIRQSEDREIDYYKGKRKSDDYGIIISKKFAGLTKYYIEASLSGYKDSNLTGLFVRARADMRVISSYWKENTPNNNIQIHKGNPTTYRKDLLLHLNLEGLNGYTCIIEIHNAEVGDDYQIKKTYSEKVINGEINLKIPASDTAAWYNEIGLKKPLEQFYIKLKVKGSKTYIVDSTSKRDTKHATHLYIKNELGEIIFPIIPKSNKVITIGDEEKKPQKIDFCKFTKISLSDRDQTVILFDENKPTTFGTKENNFRFTFDIFYDTDAYEVPDKSKPILNNIVSFLKDNNHLPATIESYADIRHDYQYNFKLTDRRANHILSYFNINGVKNKLSTTSYGESKAFQFKLIDNRDRPIHKINRKTAISITLNDMKRMYYNTIVPSIEQQTNLSFYLKDYKTHGCLFSNNNRHDNKNAQYAELVNINKTRDVIKTVQINGEKLDIKIFSSEGGMFPTQISLTPNRFELRVNCCAYFPNKDKNNIIINAFTDAVWIFHATYEYNKDYPMNCRGVNVSTNIIRGIAGLRDRAQHYVESYLSCLNYYPLAEDVYKQILNYVLDYFENEASKYGIGYGKRWNFHAGQFTKHISYTDDNKDLIEKGILTLTILVLLIELIISILTGGSYAAAKLPKLKKAADMLKDSTKKIKDMGFEFILPQIAFTYGTYFEKVNDIVHYVTQFNIKADPVIGIKFDKTLKLTELLANVLTQKKVENNTQLEKNKEQIGDGIQTLLDHAGHDAEIRIYFSGEIKQEYNLKLSSPAKYEQYEGEIKVINQLVSGFNNSTGKSIGESSIKMKAELKIKARIHVVGCIPISPFSAQTYLRNYSTQLDFTFLASLESHFNHTRTWSAGDYNGLYYQDTIYFSGIKGKIVLSNEKKKEKENWDNKINLIEINFNLFGEHTFNLSKVQFL